MSEIARRPSAEELAELVEICRRDPGSPAFIELGEMYLSLGRPRDAVEIGARGIRANPSSIEGRMMVARAMVALHQWKQAQTELLKIVKADRNHALGFALLGEVLMRREDYERALPVLQHAQNLNPANPSLLTLVRKARVGEPLDPPEPVPIPQEPHRRGGPVGPPVRPSGRMAATRPAIPGMGAEPPGFSDDAPTNVSVATPAPLRQDPTAQAGGSGAHIRERLPLQSGPVTVPPVRREDIPGLREAEAQRRAQGGGGPPSTHGNYDDAGAGVRPRPRVLPAAKPRDAAQASLRQSAAIGENYLNHLLTNGLLDIPSVRAPESEIDLAPGKRWGRSTKRAFILLFVLLFFGVGGGGTYFWWTEKQRTEAVAKFLDEADDLVATTRHDDLLAAVELTRKAIERDKKSFKAMVARGEAGGLAWLLYGIEDEQAEFAITRARAEKGTVKPGTPYWRPTLIGRAAITLATLHKRESPVDLLADVRGELDAYLADDAGGEDGLVRWLQGVAMLAEGDRSGAQAAFTQADADGEGPVVAAIYLADMLADEGQHDKALELYNRALERADKHPLALVGRALVRAETSGDADATAADLNVGLAPFEDRDGESEGGGQPHPARRVIAYKTLAQVYSLYSQEYYGDAATKLDTARELASEVTEPRYLGRIALGYQLQGKLQPATEARAAMRWYGKGEPKQRHPLAQLVDAAFSLHIGDPESALEGLGKLGGVTAQLFRARALYDKRDYKGAVEVLDEVLEVAPDDVEAPIWREGALMALARTRGERSKTASELEARARSSKTRLARYVYGDALIVQGNRREARAQLERSLEELTPEEPNPVIYRSHLGLARLDFLETRYDAALDHLAKSLEDNPSYLPTHALLGQVKLAKGDADGAIESLAIVLKDPELADTGVFLAYAQALASRAEEGAEISDEDKAAALEMLRKAKDRGARPEQITPIVELIADPAIAEEFGVKLKK